LLLLSIHTSGCEQSVSQPRKEKPIAAGLVDVFVAADYDLQTEYHRIFVLINFPPIINISMAAT
jgi:hypothetical protein